MKLLSIVVPIYNEELNAEPLYRAVNSAPQGIADRYCWEFPIRPAPIRRGVVADGRGIVLPDIQMERGRRPKACDFDRIQ
jgi:hypothetical protein